jgi:hypothetical protein
LLFDSLPKSRHTLQKAFELFAVRIALDYCLKSFPDPTARVPLNDVFKKIEYGDAHRTRPPLEKASIGVQVAQLLNIIDRLWDRLERIADIVPHCSEAGGGLALSVDGRHCL